MSPIETFYCKLANILKHRSISLKPSVVTQRTNSLRDVPRLLPLLAIFVAAAIGCRPSTPAFDHLTNIESDLAFVETNPADAIDMIVASGYQLLRDSLATRFDDGIVVATLVYTLDSTGAASITDTTMLTIGGMGEDVDDRGIDWLADLLPEQQVFATTRSAEYFTYQNVADAANQSAAVKATRIPGNDISGGLKTITIHYLNDSRKITQIEVERDGGGLLFGEKSYLDMRFDGSAVERLTAMDYTVVLSLPFKGATAYRTSMSVVDGPA